MRTVFPDIAEERLKAEFFATAPAGFFVEVGANEPERGSQTWAFERAGWTGILIEPQPDLAAKLRQTRRARVVAAACSAPANAGGGVTLFLSGPHSSLSRDLVVTGIAPHGAIEVPARTLDDILTEAGTPAPIDFVSIDVEGHEVDVLRGFDLARWRPRLVLIEDHVSSLATHRALGRAGYRLIRRTGLNGWYVPRGEAPRLGFGAVQIARKYYLALPIRMLRDRKRRWRDQLRQHFRGGLPVRAAASAPDLLSVVVTTYNREDALDAVLRALSRQSDPDFEIVVADDGSRAETAQVIARWAARLARPIKHVRQEHDGFRGGEVRNRAIRASAGKYVIFLDGDCLPRADFVAEHRTLREPGWFVTGNRMLLSRRLSETVLGQGLAAEGWSFATLLRERWRGGVNRLLPAIRLRLGPLRRFHRSTWEGAQTCNLAVARGDLERIDGFDMSYVGWGLEDSDLVVRLLRAGVRRKDGRFATGVLHLWHPRNDRSQLPANRSRLDEVIRGDHVRARRGLSLLGGERPIAARASGAGEEA